MQLLDKEAHGVCISAVTDNRDLSTAETRWLVLLIVAGVLLRIVSFIFSTNTGGDADARAALLAGWLQHPNLKLVFDGYLPGHFWLMAAFAPLSGNVELAGRLLSLILGIGSLLVFWRLVRRVYGVSAGILSVAVFCLYSVHIAYSTTTSAEVSYLFFLLLSLDLFFAFLQGDSPKLYQLAGSGICLSVAESIRFEAWVFAGGMFVILVFLSLRESSGWQWRNVSPKLLIFGAMSGLWPIAFMAYSWYVFHAPLYLVNSNSERVAEYMSRLASAGVSHIYVLAVVPVALFVGISPFASAGSVFELTRSWRNRASGALAALTLFFAAVQMYEIVRGSSASTARYTLTLGTMFSAMAGPGLQVIGAKIFSARVTVVRIAVIVLLVVNGLCLMAGSELPNRFDEKFAAVAPVLRYQHEIAHVGQHLRQSMRPGDSIVIDNYNIQSGIIAAAAGLPLLPGDRAYLAAKKNRIDVLEYINSVHPRWLVYSDRGTLQQFFKLPPVCSGAEELNGVEFRCTFTSQNYRVYELSYPPRTTHQAIRSTVYGPSHR